MVQVCGTGQNDTAQIDLYLVPTPKWNSDGNTCAGDDYRFSSTNKVFRRWTPGQNGEPEQEESLTFTEACSSYQTACECITSTDPGRPWYAGSYDNAIFSLNEQQISKMNKVEKIKIESLSGSNPVISEYFNFKKPLIINEYNASNYIPRFDVSVENLCDNQLESSLKLTAPISNLGYVHVHHGYRDGVEWKNFNKSMSYWSEDPIKEATFSFTTGIPEDTNIDWSDYYLSGYDEFDRNYIRNIICN